MRLNGDFWAGMAALVGGTGLSVAASLQIINTSIGILLGLAGIIVILPKVVNALRELRKRSPP